MIQATAIIRGQTVRATTYDALMLKVSTQLGLDVDAAKALVGTNWAFQDAPPPKRRVTLAAAVSAAKALVRDLSGSVVSNAEARRRADVCRMCPCRTEVSGCVACDGLAAFRDLVKRRDNFDLGADASCDVCGCSCGVLIWAERDVLPAGDKPPNCWMS
jgi:hypothetical protein